MGNHTNFKGMFNTERIENLEKRISRIEQIQNAECNSAQMERRVQRALIDSNNEVVRRIFDDVSVSPVFGVDVFSPKTGDIQVRNAVFFSGEVFKQAAPNGIPDYLKKVEEDKTEAPTIASVLEKAGRNTVAIQELLKRTGCSNVNEVISKFELGVSFKKMYDEEARKRKDETVKRMKMQTTLEESCSYHDNMMNRIKDLLKEVDMPSVKHTIEALKSERANGKLFAEQCELLKKENDKLVECCNCLEKNYYCERKKAREIEKSRDNLSDNYDRLAKDYEYLNKCIQNQANTIESYTKENKRLTDEVEKLKGKLGRASKRYGELIKIISDKAIKSI